MGVPEGGETEREKGAENLFERKRQRKGIT